MITHNQRVRFSKYGTASSKASLKGMNGGIRIVSGRGDRMKEESPARWAPVATGAQGKSRDTRGASLALGRGRKRCILPIFRLAGVTPAPGVNRKIRRMRLFLSRPRARDALRVSRDLRCAPVATGAHRAGDSFLILPVSERDRDCYSWRRKKFFRIIFPDNAT